MIEFSTALVEVLLFRVLKVKVDPCIRPVLKSLEKKNYFAFLFQNGYIKDLSLKDLEEADWTNGKRQSGKIIFKGSIFERGALPSKLYHTSAECFTQHRSDLDLLLAFPNVQASFGEGTEFQEDFWLKLIQLDGDGLQEYAEVLPMKGQRKISPPIDSGSAVRFLKESLGETFVDPEYMKKSKETFLSEDLVVVPRRELLVGGVRDKDVLDMRFISYFASLKSKMKDSVQIKIVGPAVNVRIEEQHEEEPVLDIDFVFGFPTEFPPAFRGEFLSRKRSSWLSVSYIQRLVRDGVLMTTKYARGEHRHTWRYCFGQQYNFLSIVIPERCKNLFRGLRYVYKAWLYPLGSGLTSHHMKTLFLWYMDDCHDTEKWRLSSDDQIFHQLLQYVCRHLETSNIPHYFIRRLNLAQHSLKVRQRTVSLQFVGSELRELLRHRKHFRDFLRDEDLALSRLLLIRRKWSLGPKVRYLFGTSDLFSMSSKAKMEKIIWRVVVSHQIIMTFKKKKYLRHILM